MRPPGLLDVIAGRLPDARRVVLDRGQVLFHAGDPGDSLHVIESGHLAVDVGTSDGRSAMLRIAGPGDHVGELAVISAEPRIATVVALERARTVVVGRETIAALRTAYPDVDRILLDAVVAEVRRLSALIAEMLFTPIPQRLVRRLAELAALYPAAGDGSVAIPLTQEQIASLCGARRSTVNQLLRGHERAGLLTLNRGAVVLHDRRRLSAGAAAVGW